MESIELSDIFMTLYGPLDTDARVQRSILAAKSAGKKVIILTCGSSQKFLDNYTDALVINKTFQAKGLINYCKFVIACLFSYLHFSKHISMVYLHDYYSCLPGRLISLFIKNKKLVYDAHELILLQEGQLGTRRERFIIEQERKLVQSRKLSLIIEANKERADIFKERYSLSNVTSVMNISKFNRIDLQRDFDRNNIILVYQGNLTEERELSFFIKSMKQLPDVKLYMIGSGPSMQEYRELSKQLNLEERVVFTGRLSNDEMMDYLSKCTIGIISYPFTNLNNIYCAPNKIFEYAAISLPFIGTKQPFIESVREEYGIGETFDYGSEASFVENVKKIIDNYSMYIEGMHDFLNTYNYSTEFEKLTKVFSNENSI